MRFGMFWKLLEKGQTRSYIIQHQVLTIKELQSSDSEWTGLHALLHWYHSQYIIFDEKSSH